MTTEEIYARFYALFDRVDDLHDKCKEENHTVESLIDVFYHFHFLAMAFSEDCHTYLPEVVSTTDDLQTLVSGINETLFCSVGHIRACQDKLNTTVIDDIVKTLTTDSPAMN